MPNGHQGSEEEWKRMEAPLVELDPVIERFAKQHGMQITRNYHSWPERSLTIDEAIRRRVQVYLKDEKTLIFNVWACAYEDRGTERFWKNAFIVESASVQELKLHLTKWLKEGYELVMSWNANDLEFATKLK